jgi:hypothetical protein
MHTIRRCRMRVHRRNRGVLQLGSSAALMAMLILMGGVSAGASGVVIKEPQYGFSFSLPAGWKQVPLNGGDVTALLKAATHDDPSLSNALSSEVASAASKGIKIFAVGPVSGSVASNVNVIVSSAAGAPTGRAFAQAAEAQAKIELTQVGATNLKTSIVNNALGTAGQVTYQLHLKNAGPEFGEQVYVQHKSSVEIVTVTTASKASSQATAQVIGNSWRW